MEMNDEELVLAARQASNVMARAAQVDVDPELQKGLRNASDLFRALSDRLEELSWMREELEK